MKRGQSALEYLMTYGWAILAVVIIAGALWYLGIFDPSRFAGEKQCGGFSAFTCQDQRMNTTGTLALVLNNKLGGAMTVTTAGCTPTSVSANANTTCTLSGYPSGTTGNSFSRVTVSVNYTDARSGLTHTDSGFVAGKYE
ncbi:MAG: hypothetical protein Q8R15_04755 [Candidatus Micrarchaeota archaeon]|nr:hypothetical protein [Candidatus Micrarchaeota archaeon]